MSHKTNIETYLEVEGKMILCDCYLNFEEKRREYYEKGSGTLIAVEPLREKDEKAVRIGDILFI